MKSEMIKFTSIQEGQRFDPLSREQKILHAAQCQPKKKYFFFNNKYLLHSLRSINCKCLSYISRLLSSLSNKWKTGSYTFKSCYVITKITSQIIL